ncbi:MAG: SH3 domain-containing protein, partial [Chloroflexota bacterium]
MVVRTRPTLIRLLRRVVIVCCLLLAISAAHAQDSTPVPDAQVTADDILRLRQAPTTTSDILTVLESATPLTVLGVSEDRVWLHVQTQDDRIGWVAVKYVDLHIDLDTVFPANGSTARLLPAVVDHIRQVYANGQRLGNHANVFAKIGDSITESILTLNPIGDGLYNLGDYAYLQAVIDFYTQGTTRDGHNSFNDHSLA